VKVDIQNLTTLDVDEKFVRKVIKAALRSQAIQGIISVGVAFVGRGCMQKLSKKYNRKNKVTDVLSFASSENFIVPDKEGRYLGEIVVCNQVVKKQAARAGLAAEKELAHVLIHGTLHLLGHEHESSAKKAKEMHGKEEEIMKELGIMN